MAAISVIVPVYDVAEYLPGCLDSILTADAGLEVIAVDDASPDGSGAILDERAAADPRLRVVHLERNGGQGAARNLALGHGNGRVRLVRRRRRHDRLRRAARHRRGARRRGQA